MLTARGWWLLLAAVLLTVTGATAAFAPTVGLLGLSMLAWFFFGGTLFALRSRFALRKLSVERVVMQNGRTITAGWTNVPIRVQLTVRNPSRWRCPVVHLTDCGSADDLIYEGVRRVTATLPPGEKASNEYSLLSSHTGVLRFDGVQVRMTDPCGFFAVEAFLPHVSTITVLPALTDAEGRQRDNKRFNALPPPGTHRFRMPGSGSELLDLRDYRPGDPPKMIAWKPSARRDRLITKEFESEVPVRCLLLIDTSNSVRHGVGRDTPACRLTTTAAGILLAATSNRDLVGVTFFDAHGTRVINPARTSSHAMRLLDELACTAAQLPDVPDDDPLRLVDHLEPLMRVREPHLFHASINGHTWSQYWRPLLDRRWGWLIFLPLLAAPVLAVQPFWIDTAARAAGSLHPHTGSSLLDLPLLLIFFFCILTLPSLLAIYSWLLFGSSGFLPGPRRRVRRRKSMAAVFAALDRDSPATIERYLRDDAAFAARAGRWLADHALPMPVRRFDRAGRDRLHEPAKIQRASNAILRATTRARDNELYVVMADLLDNADELEPLRRAVRLARSRHHQVLVVVTWPADAPTEPIEDVTGHAKADVRHTLARGTWRRYDKLRRDLTRAGATVLRLTGRDTVRTVLDHLDRLRGARSRR